MSLSGNKSVHFADVGKAMKNCSDGKPRLSDDPSYDIEDVEGEEKQSMMKTKYSTIKTDDGVSTTSKSVCLTKECVAKVYKSCVAIGVIIGVISLIVLSISRAVIHDNMEGEPWLKDSTSGEVDESLDISAHLYRSRAHRVRRCSDYEYGCCHIYSSCDISDQGELVSADTMTISPYTIVQHDAHGSNCPRMLDLITGYNNHYLEEEGFSCSESEFGCCEINYMCDMRVRFDYLRTVNETMDLWLHDLREKQTRTSLTVAKQDLQGSNCPRIRNIVALYEGDWVTEISGWWFLWGLVMVIILAACVTSK